MSKLFGIVALVSTLGVGGPSNTAFRAAPATLLTEAQIAAERAASCADFPEHIAQAIGKHYSPEGGIQFLELPQVYDIRHVVVYAAGGCHVEPAGLLPAIPQDGTLSLFHAIGIVHANASLDEPNPFYVLIELDGLSSDNREYYVLKLPKPAPSN